MKQILLAAILLITLNSQGQDPQKFNLGLEQPEDSQEIPKGWIKWGDYQLSAAPVAYSGKQSAKITADETGSSFGSIAYQIPAGYKGKTIQLNGFMKIREVQDGFAGLLLRIDGEGEILAFDNMQSKAITGTKDWEQYSITLDYPQNASYIYVAGILVGKGEAWFDDFVVTIDGKDIQKLKAKELAKAKLDKEFREGSSIVIDKWDANTLQDLELLGRVWGFVKYYHPTVAKGEYNWDYELIRFLPKYMTATGEKAKNKALVGWINSLGNLAKCKNCTNKDNPKSFLTPNLQWIEEQDKNLKKTLFQLYQDRSKGKHYYIGMVPYVGNPIFKGEKAYTNMSYPDDGFRLVALFRYWNMINYFFPYRHLMDEDWDLSLQKYLPIFLAAKNELEYELAFVQIIGDIQDTHAQLIGGDQLEAWKGSNYSPLHVRFIEDQLVVLDYYKEDYNATEGLKVGDVITAINGTPVQELVKEKAPYYPASNKPTQLRNLSRDLLRSNAKEIIITYYSGDKKEQTKILQLYSVEEIDFRAWYNKKKEQPAYKMLEGNIGYITLETIEEQDIENIKEKFKNTKGIVIDIRNYPNTFVPFTLGAFLVSAPTSFVKFTTGKVNHPGEFTFGQELKIPSKGKTYQGKVVIMVNQETQSSAEYTSMALRTGDNATVIGSTTAGADGNVSTIILPGNLKTMISGIGVYYPDGKETQRIGIVPDLEIKPTIEGIRAGRDELLEKAIELIEQ